MSKEKKSHKIWPLKVYSNLKFLTYVQVVAKCESLLCGYGTSCTVKEHTFNLTVSGEVKVATSVKNLSRLCFDFGF